VTPAVVLSINSSDPTGFAGLAADLRTFAAHELHGASIATTIGGPNEHFPLPATVVGLELSMALAEFKPAATKVGVVGTAEIAAAVGGRLRAGDLPNLVLDPALDSSGGYRRGVVGALLRLLPLATVVTPNIDEAGELVGWPVASTADMAGAAAQLVSRGAKYVVITGGRLSGEESVDAVWTDGGVRFLYAPRVRTTNIRGAGSSFSAAIASRLALGATIEEAVTGAKTYVTKALTGARDWQLGFHACTVDNLGYTKYDISTPQVTASNRPPAPRIPPPPKRSKPTRPPAPDQSWGSPATNDPAWPSLPASGEVVPGQRRPSEAAAGDVDPRPARGGVSDHGGVSDYEGASDHEGVSDLASSGDRAGVPGPDPDGDDSGAPSVQVQRPVARPDRADRSGPAGSGRRAPADPAPSGRIPRQKADRSEGRTVDPNPSGRIPEVDPHPSGPIPGADPHPSGRMPDIDPHPSGRGAMPQADPHPSGRVAVPAQVEPHPSGPVPRLVSAGSPPLPQRIPQVPPQPFPVRRAGAPAQRAGAGDGDDSGSWFTGEADGHRVTSATPRGDARARRESG